MLNVPIEIILSATAHRMTVSIGPSDSIIASCGVQSRFLAGLRDSDGLMRLTYEAEIWRGR